MTEKEYKASVEGEFTLPPEETAGRDIEQVSVFDQEITSKPSSASTDLVGLYKPEAFSLSFANKVTEAFGLTRTIGEANKGGNLLKVNDITFSAQNVKRFGVGEAKLLSLGASALAGKTAQYEKEPPLVVYADTKEFAKACGKEIVPKKMNTTEEQRKEDRRAAKEFENFRAKLRKNAENLRTVGVSFVQRIKNEKGKLEDKRYGGVSIISAYTIDSNQIRLRFTPEAAESLVNSPLSHNPIGMYKIDDRNPNAYAVADAMRTHYSMDSNTIKGTEQVLKVEKLLEKTSLPTYDENDRNRSRWQDRIKEPFECELCHLKTIGFLKDWEYRKSGQIKLTDEEAQSIISYGQFASLYVWYELAGYPSHNERLKLIADRRGDSQTGNKPKKKKRKTANGGEKS